jgi:hypothetical protein
MASRSMNAKEMREMKHTEWTDKRERGFDIGNLGAAKLNNYNALLDPNMRHFFESKQNQFLLYNTGQIDSHGRVIDYDKNKSKLHILEREFKEAERVEEKRLQEEKEMRHRVQRKRFNELERAKKSEILERLKAERELSREICKTLQLSATGGFDARTHLSTSKGSSQSMNRSKNRSTASSGQFFITEGGV